MSNARIKEAEKQQGSKKSGGFLKKYNLREIVKRVKKLEGDPHYIAMGMAIGVFVGTTPTMPFHTVIAVAIWLLFCVEVKLPLPLASGFATRFPHLFFIWEVTRQECSFWAIQLPLT